MEESGNPNIHSSLKRRRNWRRLCIPLALHGDGVPIVRLGKAWVQTVTNWSWYNLLSSGATSSRPSTSWMRSGRRQDHNENVVMRPSDATRVSEKLEVEPVFCASDFGWITRLRLWWLLVRWEEFTTDPDTATPCSGRHEGEDRQANVHSTAQSQGTIARLTARLHQHPGPG